VSCTKVYKRDSMKNAKALAAAVNDLGNSKLSATASLSRGGGKCWDLIIIYESEQDLEAAIGAMSTYILKT